MLVSVFVKGKSHLNPHSASGDKARHLEKLSSAVRCTNHWAIRKVHFLTLKIIHCHSAKSDLLLQREGGGRRGALPIELPPKTLFSPKISKKERTVERSMPKSRFEARPMPMTDLFSYTTRLSSSLFNSGQNNVIF